MREIDGRYRVPEIGDEVQGWLQYCRAILSGSNDGVRQEGAHLPDRDNRQQRRSNDQDVLGGKGCAEI